MAAMADGDAALEAAWGYLCDRCEDPYDHQVDAVEQVVAGKNVFLTTPTGSGKSLVAEAAIQGMRVATPSFRAVWTAPVKALVNDHFGRLTESFGREDVGMTTGDGWINREAPILCCTAEVLANRVLQDGAIDVDLVVMDEFHFYGDSQRGWAWQLPLLSASPRTQFLLMSATTGATESLGTDLTERTGRASVEVKGTTRPVELRYEYRDTSLNESLEDLLARGLDPVYVVHFGRRPALENAQAWSNAVKVTRERRDAILAAAAECDFDTPVGRTLHTLLERGVAVHHSSMLPKYRRLVEKLAQDRLLRVICGTDTLGVGINLPIQSVLFTGLAKFDGNAKRLLDVREFRQIAGRAGRRGFDAAGHVWVQAPEHEVERRKEAEKAARTGRRPPRLKAPPHEPQWGRSTFEALQTKDCPRLRSEFSLNAHMVMMVLDRPPREGLGSWEQLVALIRGNHGTPASKKAMARRALTIYQSLLAAGVLQWLQEPDDLGRVVRINIALQHEYALHEPLALFVKDAVAALDPSEPHHALDVVSVVESVLSDPGSIMSAQRYKARKAEVSRLNEQGVDGLAREQALDKVKVPRPLEDFLQGQFDAFRRRHPWIEDAPRPKSIARELIEVGATFNDYVERYNLLSYEGELLAHLNDVRRGLLRMVPHELNTDAVRDLTSWLEQFVRGVDSTFDDESAGARSDGVAAEAAHG